MRKRLANRLPSPSLVISLLALFVALGGTAYAATGGTFILGQANTATSQTSLTSNNAGKALQVTQQNTGTAATALGLNVPAGRTPFTVNSGTKVANLNADRLDGVDSTAFQRTTQPASNVACFGCVGTDDIASGAITESKLAAPGKWHYIGDPGEPAFENGWRNYDAATTHTGAQYQHAAYRRDINGVIHLAGLVTGGTLSQPFFHLSHTNCPWFYHALPTIANQAFARITVSWVTPTCGVWVEAASTNGWVNLSGISFRSWTLDSSTALSASQAQTLKETGKLNGRQIR